MQEGRGTRQNSSGFLIHEAATVLSICWRTVSSTMKKQCNALTNATLAKVRYIAIKKLMKRGDDERKRLYFC